MTPTTINGNEIHPKTFPQTTKDHLDDVYKTVPSSYLGKDILIKKNNNILF